MKPAIACLALAAGAVALSACQSSPHRVASTVARDSDMLGRIAQLEGEWEMTDENGQRHLSSVFAVSSAGSVVREIMFPGHEHEMTNLYHMDGPDLVMTHYCAAGNQPRMVATAARRTSEGFVYEFNFDRVSNLRPEHDHYMGQVTIILLNDGSLRQEWRSFDRDGKLTEPTVFVMTRRRDG